MNTHFDSRIENLERIENLQRHIQKQKLEIKDIKQIMQLVETRHEYILRDLKEDNIELAERVRCLEIRLEHR